jgi:Histidine kinase-, DNA gyrase B-, and HSP90-like ATPase
MRSKKSRRAMPMLLRGSSGGTKRSSPINQCTRSHGTPEVGRGRLPHQPELHPSSSIAAGADRHSRRQLLIVVGAACRCRCTTVGLLGNLIRNAVKYTDPAGRVLVGCRRRGAFMKIEVHDTGIGIPPDKLSNEAFHRLDSTRADGLGLGLFVVRRDSPPPSKFYSPSPRRQIILDAKL